MNKIYLRQKNLPIDVPEEVTLIGVGGVGSWVAIGLAIAGVKTLNLYDNDIIEIHNLNRTLFDESQVGIPKVIAIDMIISRIRPKCKVNTFVELFNESSPKKGIILDMRDKSVPQLVDEQIVTGGYDGLTFSFSTHKKQGWNSGPQTGYSETPSYVVPPMFLSSLIIDHVIRKNDKKYSLTLTIDQIYDALQEYFINHVISSKKETKVKTKVVKKKSMKIAKAQEKKPKVTSSEEVTLFNIKDLK